MSVPSYVLGIEAMASVLGALAFGAWRWRARLLPHLSGLPARVAEAILALSALTVGTELLGSVGLFRPVSVFLALVGVGVGGGVLAGRRPLLPATTVPPPPPGTVPRRSSPWGTTIAIAALAPAAGRWINELVRTFQNGIRETDSLTYHLPYAANFVHSGWVTRTYFLQPNGDVSYHPLNADLLHALGMLFLHRDTLSLIVNLGWVALFLAAAWCIGERYGAGPIAVVFAGVVVATPLAQWTQPATAQNDVSTLALLLASVAILARGGSGRAAVAVAGLGAGLAVGTKLTVLVAVAAITAGVVWNHRRLGISRSASTLAWTAPVVITGAYWYVRNTLAVGSPLPALNIQLGPVHLPHPPMILIDQQGYSVADYVLRSSVWRTWFLPELEWAFGIAWPAVLLLALTGLLVGLRRGRPWLDRMLAAAGLLSAVAYVFTPTTAFGPPGQPANFVWNLRYLWPAIMLGMLLLATDPLVVRHRWVSLAVGGALVLFISLEPEHPPFDLARWTAAGIAVAAAVICAAVALRWRPRPSRASVAWAAAVVVGLGAVVGYPVQQRYLEHRYADRSTSGAATLAWAQNIHGARIGVAGNYIYPFYGQDLSNRVRYIGRHGADHSFTDFRSCPEWRGAVDRDGYRYVVTMPFLGWGSPIGAEGWTRADPSATQVFRTSNSAVFRIDGPLHPESCALDGAGG
jgi:hypothetical protein